VALSVNPEGAVTAFGLAAANCDDRPIADCLIPSDGHEVYLADKGFSSVEWEWRWSEVHSALVAATPQKSSRRAWPEEACRWAAGKRQIMEGVIWQLKDLLSGASSGKDLGRTAGSVSGESDRVHLWPVAQRSAR